MVGSIKQPSIKMPVRPQLGPIRASPYIAIRWHWVRELIEQNLVTIDSCCDPEQTADVLTKALACPKHNKHITEMGLTST